MSRAVERAMARFHALTSRVHPPKDRLQRVAREVRDNYGMELTPAQVEENLNAAIATVRESMVRKGHREFATMSAEEVYAHMRAACHKSKED